MPKKDTDKYEIDYDKLIDRNFKKIDSEDPMFEKQHGFSSFTLEFKLSKKLLLTWDPIERLVILQRFKNKNFYVNTMLIKSLDEVDLLINFFKRESKETLRLPITWEVGSAC